MSTSCHFLKKRKPEAAGIVHHDVNGKAFTFLLLVLLAAGSMQAALLTPARRLEGPEKTANTIEARGGRLRDFLPLEQGETLVRGLDYLVPRAMDDRAESLTTLDVLRDSGNLSAYSVPSGRVAFTPDSGAVLLPISPQACGPRDVRVIYHGNRALKRVALSFDTSEVAEPRAAWDLLDELTRLRAPATFFVCGGWCYENPELLREVVERGFEIANHSYSHPMFTGISDEEIVRQIMRTEEAVRELSGGNMAAYFRPPYGDMDSRVRKVIASIGYSTVLWNKDTRDWHPATSQQLIRDRATVNAQGGDIVIMHTLGKHTGAALVEIVNNLRSLGFELTTVSGVLEP